MRRLVFALLVIAACDSTVDPPMLDLSFLVVSGDGQTGTVGSTLPQPLVIKATDAKGRAIRNLAVEFRVTSGGGSATPVSATTNNQGVAQTSWTLGTSTAAPQRLEARAVSTGQVFGAFTATALPGPAATLIKVAGDSQTATRLTPVAIRPAVRVLDQYGNAVPGVSIPFSVVTGGGTITGSPATSGADGVASVQWTLGSAVGAQHMSAVLPATAIATFVATATLGTGARMALHHGNNQVTTVNVRFPLGPAVRITDASGNPIEGVVPTYTAIQGGGSLAGGSDASRADGVYDYTDWIPCCTRGTYILRVTAAGIVDTIFFTGIAEAGPAKTIAVQAGNGQTANTGTVVLIAPAAVVRDTFGNPVPRVPVEFAVTAGGGSVTGATATTDTNGIATAGSWTLGSAPGSNTLSATASGVATAATFTATGVTPVIAVTKSRVTVSPFSIVASAGEITATVTVTARDTNDNPVVGVPVTITASGTGNTITQPTTVTDANGVTTGAISSTVAQSKHVWATITGKLTFPGSVEVRGGPPVSMVVYAGDNQLASAGTALPVVPQVLLRDQFGNGAYGTIVTWEVTGGGGSMGSFNAGTTPAGVSTGGIWTLGTVPGLNTLQASVQGTSLAVTFQATGDPSFWTSHAALPTRRFVLAAGALNGLLYAVGGLDFENMATVEAYDPATNTWTPKTPMPTRRGELGVATVNGILYAIGGVDYGPGGTAPIAAGWVEAYDPITDSWTTKTPMPTPRSDFGIAVVNGIIYTIGGGGTCAVPTLGACTTVEAYDPATDTWTTKASMPTPRYILAAAEVNGVIYAVGGSNHASFWMATVEAYDPASDTWSTKAAMPTPRYALGVAAIDGVVYAMGGNTQVGDYTDMTAVLEAYDPTTNTWTAKPPMLGPRAYMGTAVLQGLLYAVGGFGGVNSDLLEAYHPD